VAAGWRHFVLLPYGWGIGPLAPARRALQAGKKAALPGFVNETGTYQAFEISHLTRDCAPGKFGIVEPGAHCPPISLKHLDLVLAPGLGFDVSGRRLGRGQGFYDRLLAGIARGQMRGCLRPTGRGANSGGGTRCKHEFYFDADTLAGNTQTGFSSIMKLPIDLGAATFDSGTVSLFIVCLGLCAAHVARLQLARQLGASKQGSPGKGPAGSGGVDARRPAGRQ
jgi:hypothetical protein